MVDACSLLVPERRFQSFAVGAKNARKIYPQGGQPEEGPAKSGGNSDPLKVA